MGHAGQRSMAVLRRQLPGIDNRQGHGLRFGNGRYFEFNIAFGRVAQPDRRERSNGARRR